MSTDPQQRYNKLVVDIWHNIKAPLIAKDESEKKTLTRMGKAEQTDKIAKVLKEVCKKQIKWAISCSQIEYFE